MASVRTALDARVVYHSIRVCETCGAVGRGIRRTPGLTPPTPLVPSRSRPSRCSTHAHECALRHECAQTHECARAHADACTQSACHAAVPRGTLQYLTVPCGTSRYRQYPAVPRGTSQYPAAPAQISLASSIPPSLRKNLRLGPVLFAAPRPHPQSHAHCQQHHCAVVRAVRFEPTAVCALVWACYDACVRACLTMRVHAFLRR